ncbi:MAG: hypothetical protein RR490_05165 [Niameybacter sp.]
MIRKIINGHILKIYDSIDELPIQNFQKYNKLLLIDSGIGSDIDSIDAHMLTLGKYIRSNELNKAIQELQNMRQNMFMVVENISPRYMAFAALIAEIDGRKVTDLSEDNLKSILELLKQVPHRWLVDLFETLKKKLKDELELYFPKMHGSDPLEKEAYDRLKQRVLLVLESIQKDKNKDAEIEALETQMFSLSKPKVFYGTSNVEIQYDKQFLSTCLLLSQRLHIKAEELTVLQFYNAVDTVKAQIDAENKAYKSK